MLELDPLLSVGRFQNALEYCGCNSSEVNLENTAVFSPIFQQLLILQATHAESFGQIKALPEPAHAPTGVSVYSLLSETTNSKLHLGDSMPATKWQSGKALPGLTMPPVASAFSQSDGEGAESSGHAQFESLPGRIPFPQGDPSFLNPLFITDSTESNTQELFQASSVSVPERPFKLEESLISEQFQKPAVSGSDGNLQPTPGIMESRHAIKSSSHSDGVTTLSPWNIITNYISNGQATPLPHTSNLAQAETASMEVRSLLSGAPELDVDLGTPNWEQGFGEKMIWLAGKHIQTASLKLNPPELGPVEVELAIKKDQVHINFITHGVQAREALDFAIPKLRELFLLSGMNLVDVNVGDQQAHHSSGQFFNHTDMSEFFHANSVLEEEYNNSAPTKTMLFGDIDTPENLLDVYI